MKHMTENELDELIKNSKKIEDNKMIELENYNFKYCNLSEKNISNIRFVGCDFSSAILNRTDFDNCVFMNVIFIGATLYNTKFIKSKIFSSSFHHVILDNSIFTDTTIENTNMSYSSAQSAKFTNCCLFSTDFSSSNLCDSKFINTSLRYIQFGMSNLAFAIFNECPTVENIDFKLSNLCGTVLDCFQNEYVRGKILTENIIGYKASVEGYIIVLEIPAGAIVFSINGIKCRTNKAKVIDIYNPFVIKTESKIKSKVTRAYSMFDRRFSYYIGDEFNIKDFDLQYNKECSSGIHFYANEEKLIEFMKENLYIYPSSGYNFNTTLVFSN